MPEIERHPLAAAQACGAELRRRLVFGGRRLPTVLVGGIRRQSATVKDVDLLVFVPKGVSLAEVLPAARLAGPGRASVAKVFSAGPRRVSMLVRRGAKHFHVDLFAAEAATRPFALFHFTGNAEYNMRVRAHAKSRGWLLNQYGLFVRTDEAAKGKKAARVRGSGAITTERELAAFLGITYRAPPART